MGLAKRSLKGETNDQTFRKSICCLAAVDSCFCWYAGCLWETDVGAKLITNVSIVNSHNEVITSIEKDDSFKIDMTWSLEDLGDLKTSKATVTLPAEIEGVNNTYALYDENNNLVVNVTKLAIS